MTPHEKYLERVTRFTEELDTINRKLRSITVLRLVGFAAMLGLCFALYGTLGDLVYWLVPIWIIVFSVQVRINNRWDDKKVYISRLLKLNQDELAGLSGDFTAYRAGETFRDSRHHFTHDLDVFGTASLFHRINRTATNTGEKLLADWMSNLCQDKEAIEQRQEAIEEFREKIEWRQDFLAKGQSLYEAEADREGLLSWISEPRQFSALWMRVMSYVAPAVTIGLFVLFSLDYLPIGYPLLMVVINLVLIGTRVKKIRALHQQLGKQYKNLVSYATMLQQLEEADFTSKLAQQHQKALQSDAQNPSARIASLALVMKQLDMRNNGFAILFLNSTLLWDFHAVIRLEQWKERHQAVFEPWFEAIGFYDAVLSLSNFAFNHPQFPYPEVAVDQSMEFEQVGHPFIADDIRIGNDLALGTQRVNIITGANMAGKSTFLRAVGVNLVLGMMGAPVCAKRMVFYPINLFTSLRTTDSVLDGESYFFAELTRLERIIKTYESGKKIFVLLDEILKGTNSNDQHLGAKGMINRLIELDGVGLCATHDVALAEWGEQEYREVLRNYCFEITMNGTELVFDYTLRPGICQTMNASILLRQRGIIR